MADREGADAFRISDLHHSVTTARWIATTPGGVYDCTIEAPERVPLCVKRDAPR
jgi:hypothetical protein